MEGSIHDVGEGQSGGSMVTPWACGDARSESPVRRAQADAPMLPEKRRDTDMPAVPKPTQVGGYKDTKARERNLVKELGNIAP